MDINERFSIIPLNEGIELFLMPDFKGIISVYCPKYRSINEITNYTLQDIKKMLEISYDEKIEYNYICIVDYEPEVEENEV